jgi:hypothetical protein
VSSEPSVKGNDYDDDYDDDANDEDHTKIDDYDNMDHIIRRIV